MGSKTRPCSAVARNPGGKAPQARGQHHTRFLISGGDQDGPCSAAACKPDKVPQARGQSHTRYLMSDEGQDGRACWEQGLVEELKRLRAAEESAMTALVDEEMTARFSGDVTLTVRDTPTVLSPEQVPARHPPPALTPCSSTPLCVSADITCPLSPSSRNGTLAMCEAPAVRHSPVHTVCTERRLTGRARL